MKIKNWHYSTLKHTKMFKIRDLSIYFHDVVQFVNDLVWPIHISGKDWCLSFIFFLQNFEIYLKFLLITIYIFTLLELVIFLHPIFLLYVSSPPSSKSPIIRIFIFFENIYLFLSKKSSFPSSKSPLIIIIFLFLF